MSTLMILLVMQIALGGFDNLWHHELKERLPSRREARIEVALHSARELCYALLFAALAWWTWHGAWTAAVIALLVLEVLLTLADFIVEDRTRRHVGSAKCVRAASALRMLHASTPAAAAVSSHEVRP